MFKTTIDKVKEEELNASLKEKYQASLFDFSYLLALALNQKFWLQPLSTVNKEDYKEARKILKKAYDKTSDFQFLEDIRESIGNVIEKINRVLGSLSRKGRYLGERSKHVLLWTHFLVKRRTKTIEIPSKDDKKREEEAKGIIENIDWNDYYDLLRWYYYRLQNCSYSSFIKVTLVPHIKRKRGISHAKSLWQKNYKNHRIKVNNEIFVFRRIQEYFKGKEKKLPIKIGKNKWIPLDRYPIILVSFKKDSIEIGELRKKGILLKKVRFTEKQKVMSEVLKTDMKIECPTVIFPNGDPLTITDYTPPGNLSTKLLNHYLEGAIAEILKKKNNTCEKMNQGRTS